MEDLIKEIRDRTGLPTDKVVEVVTIVTDFLKENLPKDLIDQMTAAMAQAASAAGDSASAAGGAAATGATGALSAAAGIASSALSKVLRFVGDVLPKGAEPTGADEAAVDTGSTPNDDTP
ncbi:MAG: hypothetical protein R2823_07270 [Acidimicrobiia bacterium]